MVLDLPEVDDVLEVPPGDPLDAEEALGDLPAIDAVLDVLPQLLAELVGLSPADPSTLDWWSA